MSSKTYERVVRVKAIDDTTPVLMGVRRIFSSTRMEMRSLSMEFAFLAEQEIISAEAAELLGTALQAMIPIVGIIGAALGIVTAIQLTQKRSIIPVGQTGAGQFREITSTGPLLAHAGEFIGRPTPPMEMPFQTRII